MKIVWKNENFVIKETNENERSYKGLWYTGKQQLENYYIYEKNNHKNWEEYTDYADTLEEAIKIAKQETTLKNFDIHGFAKSIDGILLNDDIIETMLHNLGLENLYEVTIKHNYMVGKEKMTIIHFYLQGYSNEKYIYYLEDYTEEDGYFRCNVIGIF